MWAPGVQSGNVVAIGPGEGHGHHVLSHLLGFAYDEVDLELPDNGLRHRHWNLRLC